MSYPSLYKKSSCKWGKALEQDLKHKNISATTKTLSSDDTVSPLLCSDTKCILGYVDIPEKKDWDCTLCGLNHYIDTYCVNNPSNCKNSF